MSSTETLVVAHLGLSAGGCWFSTHKLLLYPTSVAGPVSIGASSPAVDPIWEVSRRRLVAMLRFGLSFS